MLSCVGVCERTGRPSAQATWPSSDLDIFLSVESGMLCNWVPSDTVCLGQKDG